MSEQPETPQGPVDPHGEGGIDAPAPPGGPQRTDAPGPAQTPGENAPDPEPAVPTGAARPRAGQRAGRRGARDEERAQQEENAETSLDQPSG